jgi:hypothetical protein
MAEVAGLVIGGVSLVALFDTTMSAFDKIESGKNFGRAYKRSALNASILRLRLARWREAVDAAGGNKSIGTKTEHDLVEDLLGDIGESIKATERFKDRYGNEDKPGSTAGEKRIDATMDDLAARTSAIALKQQKDANFFQKARWAIRDQSRYGQLLASIDYSIQQLENVFPAAMAAQQHHLARSQAEEIVHPSSVEEPEDTEMTFKVLAESTTNFDKILQEALKSAAQKRGQGHNFANVVNLTEKARYQRGDYIKSGAVIPQDLHYSNYTGTINVSGTSRAHEGLNIDGPYVLGDDFHDDFH